MALRDDLAAFNRGLKQMVTPAGVARFPSLTKSAVWDETAQKSRPPQKGEKGHYSTKLVLDPKVNGVAEFLAKLEGYVVEARNLVPKNKQKKFHSPIRVEEDEDGEATGMVIISAKTGDRAKDGTRKKLPVVDAKKHPVHQEVWGGSTVKLAVTPAAYVAGVNIGMTLYLNAAQVLQLVAAGGGAVNAFDEEEGFEEDAQETGDPEEFEGSVEADEGDDDF